jgi:hypothetical protein
VYHVFGVYCCTPIDHEERIMTETDDFELLHVPVEGAGAVARARAAILADAPEMPTLFRSLLGRDLTPRDQEVITAAVDAAPPETTALIAALRPGGGRTWRVTLTLDAATRHALKVGAAARGVTAGELVRQALASLARERPGTETQETRQ